MKVSVQPRVLEWARQRASLDEAALAKKLGAKEEQVERWEDDGVLTYKRLEKLAQVTHVPFGYLFLEEPPAEKLPVTDFRTVGSQGERQPSPELLDVLYDAMRKQEWYREYLLDMETEPLVFIGSATLKTSPGKLAAKIRKDFRLAAPLRSAAVNWEQALGFMFDHCEEAGVLVLRSGVAGGNPHRPLSVEEFRGFALSDPYAPVIFINSKDSPAAQMFTLMHELVHLWLGVSGVSNLEKTYAPDRKVERFCNQTAAEILVPEDELKGAVEELGLEPALLRRRFKVSLLVILRRLKDLGWLDAATFRSLYQEEERAFVEKRAKQKGGGDYYATQRVRVGSRFAKALIGSALEGRTTYREAYALLGVKKAETFTKFARELKFDL